MNPTETIREIARDEFGDVVSPVKFDFHGRFARAGVDWDQWRAEYDAMSFAEHQAFNAAVRDLYPVQRSYNTQACRRFLEQRNPRTVLELGGWDGGLAAELLPEFPCVESWVNYDITPDVPQECTHPAYKRVVLKDWPWNQREEADALLASHVFEHMRIREIARLVDMWEIASIYVDAPIGPDSPSWDGYQGTHVLEVGYEGLILTLEDLGFTCSYAEPGFVGFFDWVTF